MPETPRLPIAPILRRTPLFASVDDAALAQLAAACRGRRLRKGQLLFGQGDPADALYVVATGNIGILLPGPDGRELLINEMAAGDVFGELGLIAGNVRSTSAQALDACEVIVVPRAEFMALLDRQPRLVRQLLEITARRLEVSGERESSLAFLDAPGRVARLLLQLDRQSSATGFVTISQEDLAQRAGLARQTVATILGKWRRSGWILTGRGRIVVLNRPAVRRQIDEGER